MSDPEQALKTFADEILAELFGMKAFTVAVVELAGILYSDLAAASDPDNDTLKPPQSHGRNSHQSLPTKISPPAKPANSTYPAWTYNAPALTPG